MNTLLRPAVLLMALAPLAVCALGLPCTWGPADFQEARRDEELQRLHRATFRRLEFRREVVQEVIARRCSLAEALALFRWSASGGGRCASPLTFEWPGGGFDWWGRGEPLVWLSAYGPQELSDMSKVHPVGRGVIERTQRWLMKQQATDGTWSKIGMTHGIAIEQMGDPKLLLTSYLTWSLLDSGLKAPELK